MNFIIAIGIFYIFNIHFSNFTEIIIYIFFIIILTVLSISNDIKYRVKRILQKKQEKIYFYNDFLFIKNEEIIFKCDYDCIKSFIEDNEFIFIKIKQLLSPIIINKKSIQNININF